MQDLYQMKKLKNKFTKNAILDIIDIIVIVTVATFFLWLFCYFLIMAQS